MMFWIYLLKPLVYLGSSEFTGSLLMGIIRTILRVLFIFTMALFFTALLPLNLPVFNPPPANKVRQEVNIMLGILAQNSDETILKESGIQTSDLNIIICQVKGKNDDNCEETELDNEARAYRVILRCTSCGANGESRSQRLLTSSPLSLEGLSTGIKQFLEKVSLGWPFLVTSFESGPYVGAAMLIESATNRNSGNDASLNQEDIRKIRGILDLAMENLPSADKSHYVWPRRLMGWIQFICYWLFFVCIVHIILIWCTTVLPNSLLRWVDSFKIEGKSYHSPWYHLQRANASFFVLLYETIDKRARKASGILGASAVFPIADFRRTAYLAMISSVSGSDVPTFISVESDAHRERLEATTKMVEYIIWAIPTLGFIGTVIGIGDALLATVKLDSGLIVTKAIAESQVGTRIGVAFDTTLVALVLSFILMLCFYLLQGSHERMLAYEKRSTLSDLLKARNIKPQNTNNE